MATLSSPGIGSGLDVTSMVTQLVALERKPIDDLKAAAATIQTKLSSFGLLSSYTSNLRDIADKLTQSSFWSGTAATSADASSVAVSSTSSAVAATYLVNVTSLARAQGLASATAYASSSSVVGTGSLHIELGSWDTGLTTFTPDTSKVAVDVNIDASSNTLDGIKTKINAANAGVTASIVNDASGAKLVLTSTSTGAKSAVRLTVVDNDGTNTNGTGLSALGFNPPASAGGQMSQTQAAKDAAATVNGLAVTSATNKLDGVISGVTLTLSKETTSPVEVRVSQDTASIKKAITDFAKAFSDMNGYITAQTKYDAATKKAAALQGDRSTLAIQSNLRRLFTDSSPSSLVYARLSDIGLEMQTDGTMKVNDTKLSVALANNPTEVSKMFTSTASADPDKQGFAVRAKALATALIGSDGAITTRTKSLRDSVTRNEKDQAAMEARVALTQARLTKQYGALDVTLSTINATNSSLTQSLKALQAQTSSGS